jgi:hypothetical protein
MSAARSEITPRRHAATPASWKPGQSGNPNGRAKAEVDIAALARVHGPRCVQIVVDLLKDRDSKIRLAAATVLLDRGFGKPKQEINATADGTLTLHLVAAQTIGRELLETVNANSAPVIDGHISSAAQDDTSETKQLDQTVPIE